MHNMDGEGSGGTPHPFEGFAADSTEEQSTRQLDFRDFTFTRLLTDDNYDPFEGDIPGTSQSFDDWLSREYFPPSRESGDINYINIPGPPAGGFSGEDITMFEPPMAFEELENSAVTFEELLELHARIGNVNPGLSDEFIAENLRREIHQSSTVGAPVERELCSICQEEYADGEDVSKLSCGHDVHFDCIRQWLVRTNSCPLCKRIALAI